MCCYFENTMLLSQRSQKQMIMWYYDFTYPYIQSEKVKSQNHGIICLIKRKKKKKLKNKMKQNRY